MSRQRANRDGFTLVELLVSMTLFSIILMAALGAVQRETRAFNYGNDRLTSVQNYRYAVASLQQDLEQAGAGVVPTQPPIVYAGGSVFAFNADYASNTPGDMAAVFIEPQAPDVAVSALRKSQRARIPTTSFDYPDTDYFDGSDNSPAETLIFFIRPDDTTERTDDFALFRQVNREDPELLSTGLVRIGNQDFFSYRELVTSDTASDRILPLPPSALPLAHTVATHRAPADAGAAGRIDNLRAVEVRFGVIKRPTDDGEEVSLVRRLIWLRNIRERPVQMCGDQPLPVPTPVASGEVSASGDPMIRLSWSPAPDDGAAEDDIMGYVIWRRPDGATEWGDPYLSLPSGKSSYVYEDGAVAEGERYEYTVAAQDCTPAMSIQSGTAAATVPAP